MDFKLIEPTSRALLLIFNALATPIRFRLRRSQLARLDHRKSPILGVELVAAIIKNSDSVVWRAKSRTPHSGRILFYDLPATCEHDFIHLHMCLILYVRANW